MNEPPRHRYQNSEAFLKRALEVIPLASQTFSKSTTHIPKGAAPLFVERGKGSKIWDIDGNEYIDFVNSLAAVTLGYCDPDVDQAVLRQLQQGVTFSLPHPLETELAEKLVELIPCAEKIRFAKNGTDATSAAIRVARAFTGRDRVAVCGYHGWQDWYIGTTARNLGVPDAVSSLSHTFTYNDTESLLALLEAHPDEFAAVILEPMNSTEPRDGFLHEVKRITHNHGALLIFDETVTGFRFSLGGAQALFGVTPDLATFGKGMANGFPLAAVVGRSEFMRMMEDIFFSGTFGGETLSLAAAKTVIHKMESEGVLETIYQRGENLVSRLRSVIQQHDATSLFSVSGHPSWSFLKIHPCEYTPFEVKTYLFQLRFERGIFALGSHNISYAHSQDDIDRLIEVYDEVIPMIMDSIRTGTLIERLTCEPLQPIFQVR
ncbi:MAG: aminotransferase class III-fold pyridoxal phosphate-dependent enzyme [Gammaproteobacteria bacterium]|nr:aminotransferase class III-fold pyridoxal phosphate-dependent enzyme [Gammaproteobacteria bacterium]